MNVAFAMVRQLIPTEPPDRKMSKIEILKLATSYIQHLKCHCIAGKLTIYTKQNVLHNPFYPPPPSIIPPPPKWRP